MYIYEITPERFRISIRTDNGRRTRVSHGLLNAINDKWALLKEINEEQTVEQNKNLIEFKTMTVSDGIELYMKERLKLVDNEELEQSTYEDDLVTIDGKYLKDQPFLSKRIIDVDKNDAQDFIDYLRHEKSEKDGTKLSENTIYKPFAFVHKVFNYFINDLEVISANPFSKVNKKPKYIPKQQKYLITEEIKDVLSKLKKENIRFQVMINLFLETGLRVEELCGLQWHDINRVRQTIDVSRAIVKLRKSNQIIVKKLKTIRSEREITISKYTLDLIEKYKTFKTSCGFVLSDNDFIFTSWLDNDIIIPKRYSDEWRSFTRKYGYDNVPLKNLRHTSITFMLQGETNPKAVQIRSGHSKINTTMSVYNQTNLYEDRKLINKFDSTFRNTHGFSIGDLYRICVDRYQDKKKMTRLFEELNDTHIDFENYESISERTKEYLMEEYPIFKEIKKIDTNITDRDIDCIFDGYQNEYKNIVIDKIEKPIKI